MPNRLLREDLLTSDRVAALAAEEERLYTRLILVVDDYGLCDARPPILKAKAFPLNRTITEEQVETWLTGIEKARLGERYSVAGKSYFWLYNTRQRIRADKPKFPLPPNFDRDPLTDDGHSSADGGPPRPKAKSKSKSKAKADSKARGGGGNGHLPLDTERPAYLPPNWEAFVEERRHHGSPMTERAREGLMRKLAGWHAEGYDVQAIVQDSIDGGWTGLFAKPRHRAKGRGAPSQATIERFVAAGARKT